MLKAITLITSISINFSLDDDTHNHDHKIITYWGQNGIWNHNKDPNGFEKGLSHFCENSNYDVINLSFLNVFFDERNKGTACVDFIYYDYLEI